MIAIIGAGLSGLICGKILAEHGEKVVIFEAGKDIGGLARCFSYENYKLPVFYHHVFAHDRVTLATMKELGIKDFYKKRIKMGISFADTIYEISWIKTLFWDFLSWRDKFKFGLLALKTKLKKNWKELEGKNAEQWLLKEVGKNVAQKIFSPLMREKYGLALKDISASELASRLKEGEATGKFLYPKKGLYEMLSRLRKKVEKHGGEIKLVSPVTKISFGNEIKIQYQEKGKRKIMKARKVVNSAPVPVFLKVAKGLPQNYRKKLERIKYCSSICVDIFYSSQLSKFYWINVFDKSFGGIIEHTNLAKGYEFKFAWIWKYAPGKLWNLSDKQIAKLFIGEIKQIFPHAEIFDYRVFREQYASPLYDKNYAKYMPNIKTPLKNLYFTGVATTYPEIRTMNTALKSGIKTAKTIIGDAHEQSSVCENKLQ